MIRKKLQKSSLVIILSLGIALGGAALQAMAAEDDVTFEVSEIEGYETMSEVPEAEEYESAFNTLGIERLAGDSGVLGKNNGITWTFDAETHTLTVSGEDELSGEGYVSAFADICAGHEVSRIVFRNCKLSGSAQFLFCGLKTVTEIDCSGLDTSAVTSMYEMFCSCTELTSVNMSGIDTGAVTNMAEMFRSCCKLTSLDLSSFNTKQVTDMGQMFYDCRSLTSLNVSSFDTSAVTTMDDMFGDCQSLVSLDVSGFNTGAVRGMYGMFNYCLSLTSLDVSNFNTSAVTSMNFMFGSCKSLTALDVSKFDTSAVTNMRSMFGICENLKSLDVSNFNTAAVTDMSVMFDGCASLTSLDVSKFNTVSVTDMGAMFQNCSGLTSLDVSGFKTGAVTDMCGMFSGCSGLTSLELSHFDTAAVKNMSGMFWGCINLTSLDLSSFDTRAVTEMEQMLFYATPEKLKTPAIMGEKTAELTVPYQDENGVEYRILSSENTGKVLTASAAQNTDPGEKFNIIFDGNKATGGGMPKMTDLSCGREYILSKNQFERPGYIFAGWNTNPAGSGIAYRDEETIVIQPPVTDGKIVLYAQWKVSKYTIRFDGNGAAKGKMTALKNCGYGKKYALKANQFKRTGYSFAGWNTAADGSGVHYQNKESVKDLTDQDGGTVTLYAQWREGGFAVTYHLSGGSNHPDNPDNYDENTPTITLKEPTREGYVFAGWYRDSKMKKSSDGIAQGSRGDKNFYAKWKANKYTIKYDSNASGGAVTGSMSDQSNRSYGRKYTLPANKFKRKGYTFSGWNTAADGRGLSYKNKAGVQNLTAEADGSVTLYAQWKIVNYSITYKLNGGSDNPNPSSYNVETATFALQEPTRADYTFDGWYPDSKFKKDRVNEITQGSSGKMTLYAKWK